MLNFFSSYFFFLQSGRNALVLQQTHTLAERAVSVEGQNSDFVNELGSQLLMAGKTKDAMKCFRTAMKVSGW
jgi:tetratricopeptide repeat protein 21B